MNTLPIAVETLRTTDPAAEGQKGRASCPPGAVDVVLGWHRGYAAAARALARDFTMRGATHVTLPQGDEEQRELAATRCYVLCNQAGHDLDAMLALPPEPVLRGGARMFLTNGALPLHVQEYLVQLATWEERWIEAFGRRSLS